MRIPLTIIVIIFTICPAIDLYIWRALDRLKTHPRLWQSIHAVVAAACYIMVIIAIIMPRRSGDDAMLSHIMWMLFAFASIYIPKILYTVIGLLSQLPCLFHRPRIKAMGRVGTVIAVALFAAMWHGALINRFRLQVKEVEIYIPSLPDSFDGMTIAQISDIHSGTYGNDTSFISRIVDRTNSLGADITLFTGDIVNRHTPEIFPHLPALSRLKAPMGVYAILGNHDYGDYHNWTSQADKERNMQQLYDAYRRIGWHLLKNETTFLHRGNDSIALIGVENIGDPPFHVYGSLEKAYPAGADGIPKILLSHNPAHWLCDIADGRKPNDIALTLSGHTHAMQIEVMGLSPAAFRYPAWGGLYSDSQGRNLYINIGTGTVGIPMRLGATPEITLITLRKGTSPLPHQ
ncbi:MAG: metallophosphoesterase [Pseudoflavonifractor sp.]|nr:metallophosphoesterase [Alloprevotella sp.]MCM1116551.1 metallophosphoesterase [Pseudoflavonifractor sp.]